MSHDQEVYRIHLEYRAAVAEAGEKYQQFVRMAREAQREYIETTARLSAELERKLRELAELEEKG